MANKKWDDLKQLVINRDGKICCHCKELRTKKGKIKQLHLSHILPRGEYSGLTYEPDNVVLLCSFCHLHWWHKNPIEAYMWILDYKGKCFINRLLKKGHEYKKNVHTAKENKTKHRQKNVITKRKTNR